LLVIFVSGHKTDDDDDDDNLEVYMASRIGFYSQLPISAIGIADIANSNY